jgi:hypothetical protein
MSDITFANGTKMHVENLYSTDRSDKSFKKVDKAISSLFNDNTDYVVFKGADKLMIATGKGNLTDNKISGGDKAVKFNFEGQEYEAIKVINRTNTDTENEKAIYPKATVLATSIVFGGLGFFVAAESAKMAVEAMSPAAATAIGMAIGLGVGLCNASGIKEYNKTINSHPGMDSLLHEKAVVLEE